MTPNMSNRNHNVNADSQLGHSRSNDAYMCKGITGGILNIDNLMVLKDRSELFYPLSLLLHNTKPAGHQVTRFAQQSNIISVHSVVLKVVYVSCTHHGSLAFLTAGSCWFVHFNIAPCRY